MSPRNDWTWPDIALGMIVGGLVWLATTLSLTLINHSFELLACTTAALR